MSQRSGTPTAHHKRWLAETELDPESPGVDIHQMGGMGLESAVTYDLELDGSACVCPALRDHLAQELQREMA
eukprot:7794026-Pyramimonas_sp.AAC.1